MTAAATETERPAKPAKPIREPFAGQVSPERTHLAEQVFNCWHCVAPKGCTPEDLDCDPQPWQLIAPNATRFDHFQVVAEDDTWLAEFICIDAGPGWAACKLVHKFKLPARRPQSEWRPPEGYAIRQGGPAEEPWIAYREKDGVVLNGNCFHATREEALRFLIDHPAVRGSQPPTLWGKRG